MAGSAPVVPSSSMILALPPVASTSHSAARRALLDEVGADEGDVILARLGDAVIDVAVDEDDRNAGLLDFDHLRRQRLRFARREDDDVRLLGDDRVDVGELLGRVLVGVRRDQRPAELFLEGPSCWRFRAIRQGLLLPTCAKPMVYVSFCSSGGSWAKTDPV